MIGPHIIGSINNYEGLFRRWQPRAALLLDPSDGAAASIKRWSPGTFLIGRIFREDSEIHNRILNDPESAAGWAADLIRPAAQRNPEIDVWQFNNEVAQSSPDEIGKLAHFSIRYVELLAEAGLRAAIGAFSVGRPEAPINDSSAAWGAFLPAMRTGMKHGAVLLLHAYGAPQIFESSPDWFLHRFERVVRPHLPADVREMPYVYGEFGCDMGVKQPGLRKGWQTGYSGDFRAFAADLKQAAGFLAAQPNCLGACVYSLGGGGGWADFDINGHAAEELAGVAWPAPLSAPVAPPPAPPAEEAAPVEVGQPAGEPLAPDLQQILFRQEGARPIVDYAGDSRLLRRIVADGFVPTTPEFTVDVAGSALLAQHGQHPASGAVRIYYLPADQPAQIGFVAA